MEVLPGVVERLRRMSPASTTQHAKVAAVKSTQYSEKTLDHFRNPRNVGVLEGDDVAVGRVGNPVCGDLMEMYIRVRRRPIDDITFQTFGAARRSPRRA